MTLAKKLTIDVPPDRIVRLPDSVPLGKVEILVTGLGSTDEPSDEERARRRANRGLLAGQFAGQFEVPDEAFAPMTEEELAEWYRPIDL